MARVVVAGVAHPITPRGGLLLCGNACEQAALPAARLSHRAASRWSAERCGQSPQDCRDMNQNRVASPYCSNTPWNVPHLSIGNEGQVHLEVPAGYKLK